MITVAIDIDNCVCDMMPEWLRLYNKKYHDHVKQADITNWDMARFLKCTMDDMLALLPKAYDRSPVMEGAKETIQSLRKMGFDIVFVTAGVYPEKMHWMVHHGLSISKSIVDPSDIIIARNKNYVAANILIDDGFHNVETFSGPTILFDQPWNMDCVAPYRRANDWHEVKELMIELWFDLGAARRP